MKVYSISIALALLFACGFAVSSVDAQFYADELRPFDFHDKYYFENGVRSDMFIGRTNGADGESVIDFSTDARHSNVRITATRSAYDQDGNTIFWNYTAGMPKNGFTEDMNGARAIEHAYATPLYIFPSVTVANSDRQSPVIRTKDTYFEKNQIGISAVFFVEFTELSNTRKGQAALEAIAKRNGRSVDSTPIIKTEDEVKSLAESGLVTLTQPSLDEKYFTPFALAKVLQYPNGGIAPDAFLIYVKSEDGKPIPAEAAIFETFECHKAGGSCK